MDLKKLLLTPESFLGFDPSSLKQPRLHHSLNLEEPIPMSYSIHLAPIPDDSSVLELADVHHERGGTYVLGGTNQASLSVTYNYSGHFARAFVGGIRSLYGRTARESIALLDHGISILGTAEPPDADYWQPTAGNAVAALQSLRRIAAQAVSEGYGEALWSGD